MKSPRSLEFFKSSALGSSVLPPSAWAVPIKEIPQNRLKATEVSNKAPKFGLKRAGKVSFAGVRGAVLEVKVLIFIDAPSTLLASLDMLPILTDLQNFWRHNR